MKPSQVPTLGRIVHFTCDTNTAMKLNNQAAGKRYNVGEKVPGMITGLGENDDVYLTLFPASDKLVAIGQVPFSSGGQFGTWNWPEIAGIAGSSKTGGETGSAEAA